MGINENHCILEWGKRPVAVDCEALPDLTAKVAAEIFDQFAIRVYKLNISHAGFRIGPKFQSVTGSVGN